MTSVTRIVLTGGPCGGKTTALARVSERLTTLGYRVFLVPEIPTILLSGGLSFAGVTPSQLVEIEGHLLRLQLAAEDAFCGLAHASGVRSVVICDRGAIDVSAYLPRDSWQAVLDENGWSVTELRDRRYEGVFHLVTAANGAEGFYTLANNKARTESPELARELDDKVRDAWVGHPHLRVVDNSTDFDHKVRRVVEEVCRLLGEPEPVETERKFLVESAPLERMPVRCEVVEIEQTYLTSQEGEQARVRRRGMHGSFAYTHTIKRPLRAGQRIEVERSITAREYVGLLAQADPTRTTVRKRRHCFLWESNTFELDEFITPWAGKLLLEVEVADLEQRVPMPPFLKIVREVTEEPAFTNAEIALIKEPQG